MNRDKPRSYPKTASAERHTIKSPSTWAIWRETCITIRLSRLLSPGAIQPLDFPQVVVIPWTPRREPNLIVNPGRSPKYTPPRIRGDFDLDTDKGNPAAVHLVGEISVAEQQVLGRVYMYVRESDPDHTSVEGWSEWQTLYDAPAGWKITSVRPTAASVVDAQLTSHETPDYGSPAGEVVQNFHVWGDRDGNEAGTYTGVEVTWQNLNITLEEIAPVWLR